MKIKFKNEEQRNKAVEVLVKEGWTALSEQKKNKETFIKFKNKGQTEAAYSLLGEKKNLSEANLEKDGKLFGYGFDKPDAQYVVKMIEKKWKSNKGVDVKVKIEKSPKQSISYGIRLFIKNISPDTSKQSMQAYSRVKKEILNQVGDIYRKYSSQQESIKTNHSKRIKNIKKLIEGIEGYKK